MSPARDIHMLVMWIIYFYTSIDADYENDHVYAQMRHIPRARVKARGILPEIGFGPAL